MIKAPKIFYYLKHLYKLQKMYARDYWEYTIKLEKLSEHNKKLFKKYLENSNSFKTIENEYTNIVFNLYENLENSKIIIDSCWNIRNSKYGSLPYNLKTYNFENSLDFINSYKEDILKKYSPFSLNISYKDYYISCPYIFYLYNQVAYIKIGIKYRTIKKISFWNNTKEIKQDVVKKIIKLVK